MLNKGNDFYSYPTMFWKDEWNMDLAEKSIRNPEVNPFDPVHEPKHTPICQSGVR